MGLKRAVAYEGLERSEHCSLRPEAATYGARTQGELTLDEGWAAHIDRQVREHRVVVACVDRR